MKKLLKKKIVIIPAILIIYIILFSRFTELIGALTLIGGTCGGVYLFTKNENFKSKHIAIKILTGIAIFFIVIIFGIGGISYGTFAIENAKDKQLTNDVQATEEVEVDASSKAEDDTKAEETKEVSTKVVANLELKVHYINVGQADAILIQQGSSSMLIDGGNNEDSSTVKSYIENQGITKLDYVIGTHTHEDHIGGLDYVINSFNVLNIYFPKQTATTKTFEDFINAVKSKGLQLTSPTVGEIFKLGDATCTIIAPNSASYEDANDYSIVVKIQYGNTSFLLDGDAEAVSEMEIINKGLDIKADVLKVGHHGSSSSSSAEFISAVSPKYAVISVAADNSYGHPAQGTMDRLKAANIQVYRTDENGTIVAISNGTDITFSTKPGSYKGKATISDSSTKSESNTSSNSTSKSSTVNGGGVTTNVPAQDDRTVYWTSGGKSYHYDKNCRTLARSKKILEGAASSCPKTDPCNVCVK